MTANAKAAVYAAGAVVLVVSLVLVGIVAFPWLVGGDDAFVVTSDSMSPTIESGDVIVTRDVPADEVEPGDVVTVRAGDGTDAGYVTHRVVDVVERDGERYLRLQGDANEGPDEGLVPAEYVRGERYIHVPHLGHLFIFARSTLGLLVLVIAPGLALVASGGWQLLREFGYVPDEATEDDGDETVEDDASDAPASGGDGGGDVEADAVD